MEGQPSPARCPALMISAPASGQGKTLVTAALARRHRNAGRRVRVFKCGPDFLDPMILERASGMPVFQLDLFMGGEAHCRSLLHQAAAEADVILVEGVMGLFDGEPSAADLAACFGLPVLLVMDASAMAQTFGALVAGLADWRADVHVAGAVANRVGGDRHAAMLRDSLRAGTQWLGALPREDAISLPERHLGLVQAAEIDDLDARLDAAASLLPQEADWLPPEVTFEGSLADDVPRLLEGRRIAIARDDAFAFVYPANIAVLKAMGATLSYFSPLADAAIPECDALWLPGGYPELHLARLSANHAIIASIRRHHAAGKPILAECGGMLFCLDRLDNIDGDSAPMAGLMPGRAIMQRRLAALGLQEVSLGSGLLRGHTFHYSSLETPVVPGARATNRNGGAGESVFFHGSLVASYVHFYFASHPSAAAALF